MSPAAVARTPALFGAGAAVPGEAATRQLLADYAVHVARLTINPDSKRL